jgi:hypothetical protein
VNCKQSSKFRWRRLLSSTLSSFPPPTRVEFDQQKFGHCWPLRTKIDKIGSQHWFFDIAHNTK